MYVECICVFIKILSLSLKAMLIVDKHCSDVCCDKFPMPQTDCKSKQVKEHSDTENSMLQSVWGKIRYLKHPKYQNLWINNKVRRNENAICLHFHIC